MGNSAYSKGERRRHDRLEIPQLSLRVGGRVYQTVDWSFGGFLIEDGEGALPTGALIRIDGMIEKLNRDPSCKPEDVDIRARVIRVMPEHGLAALTCLHIDDSAYRIMNAVRDGNPLATQA